MSKVLLISSNTAREPYPVYPLGMAVLASALSARGHTVCQYDFLVTEQSERLLQKTLSEFEPDYIGISLRNIDNANPVAPKDPHTIHLHGQQVTTQNDGFNETSFEVPELASCVNPDGSPGTCNEAVYYWYADKAGTFMWHCHVEASEHVQMGMYGALVIRPKTKKKSATHHTVFGGFYNDRFDREYIVLLSDVETTAHDAIQSDFNASLLPTIYPDTSTAAINNYNFVNFRANAWLVNGRAWPDTIRPISTPAADQACITTPRPSGRTAQRGPLPCPIGAKTRPWPSTGRLAPEWLPTASTRQSSLPVRGS